MKHLGNILVMDHMIINYECTKISFIFYRNMINDRIQIVVSHHPGVIVYERQVIWTDWHIVRMQIALTQPKTQPKLVLHN